MNGSSFCSLPATPHLLPLPSPDPPQGDAGKRWISRSHVSSIGFPRDCLTISPGWGQNQDREVRIQACPHPGDSDRDRSPVAAATTDARHSEVRESVRLVGLLPAGTSGGPQKVRTATGPRSQWQRQTRGTRRFARPSDSATAQREITSQLTRLRVRALFGLHPWTAELISTEPPGDSGTPLCTQ